MADVLSRISVVSFGLAIMFLVLAVFFWFKFGILGIIGDLSGRTARKSIAMIRENNEKTGKKNYRPSTINTNRGKLTEKMKESGNLIWDQRDDPVSPGSVKNSEAANRTALTEINVTDTVETAPLAGQSFGQRRGLGSVEMQTEIHTEGWKIVENIRMIYTDEMID